MAASEFEVELRVGLMTVKDCLAAGENVSVANLEISSDNHLVIFAGGGIDFAERAIKNEDPLPAKRYAVDGQATPDPDLEGLSCRWEPLLAERGRMATLMIRVREKDARSTAPLYRAIVTEINAILKAYALQGRPARSGNLRFRWPLRGLSLEATTTRGKEWRWRRWLEVWISCLVQLYLERHYAAAGSYDSPVYRQELCANTDFQRIDGTLRFVIDCTAAELTEMEAMLEKRFAAGEIN